MNNPPSNLVIHMYLSLSLNHQQPLDYRIEIERRFKHSTTNQNYVFPRRLLQSEPELEEDNSLIGITIYNLHS